MALPLCIQQAFMPQIDLKSIGDRSTVMSFGFLVVGCLFIVAGVAYLAHLMEFSEAYVMGAAFLLVGLAAGAAAQSARRSRI